MAFVPCIHPWTSVDLKAGCCTPLGSLWLDWKTGYRSSIYVHLTSMCTCVKQNCILHMALHVLTFPAFPFALTLHTV